MAYLEKNLLKIFLEKIDSDKRLGGTVSSSLFAMMQGVQILRVHDVNDIIQGIKVFKKLIKINGKKVFWNRWNKRSC